MSGNFKVGEVLVGQNCTRLPRYNGVECELLELEKSRLMRDSLTGEVYLGFSYLVRWVDGRISATRKDQLRRKQPPTGEQSVLDMFKLPAPSKEIA